MIYPLPHFWCNPLVEVFEQLRIPHKTQVEIAHAFYHPISSKFAQSVKRKDAVYILIGMAMVVMFMCDHQLAAIDIPWNFSPVIITIQRKRYLLTKMDPGSRNNGKGAFA